jgi:hypothetical protein
MNHQQGQLANEHRCRRLHAAGPKDKAQLAAVMDSDEPSSRHGEFAAFLDEEFATLGPRQKSCLGRGWWDHRRIRAGVA